MKPSAWAMPEKNTLSPTSVDMAEVRRLAVTMSVSDIGKQLGVDNRTVYRWRGWRAMPEPTDILPAPPEQVYLLMLARTTDRTTIRHRIDVFCRAISDRAFAKEYRNDLLALHRRRPDRPIPAGIPVSGHNAPALPGAACLIQMAAACHCDHTGLRDRALLLLLAVSGLDLRTLGGLDVENVCFDATAVQLTIYPTGEQIGRVVVRCDDGSVQALRSWLQALGTSFGPAFCQVDRWGNIDQRRLQIKSLRQIVVSRTPPAGRAIADRTETDESTGHLVLPAI